MKCRLLYLIGELHTGGSERQLYYLLQAMDRGNYKPAVAVWNYSEQDLYVPLIRDLGVPLHSIKATHSRAAKLAALREVVRNLKPEVVHSWSFYTNFAAHYAAKGSGSICVGSVRSGADLGGTSAGHAHWRCGFISTRHWPEASAAPEEHGEGWV